MATADRAATKYEQASLPAANIPPGALCCFVQAHVGFTLSATTLSEMIADELGLTVELEN